MLFYIYYIMNTIHCNDLPNLNNIIDIITAYEKPFYNSNDSDDLKETIDIFLNDYLNNNIQIYKEYNFYDIIFTYLFTNISNLYENIIYENDINVENIINETMYCYFMRHNNPRSYNDNRIIKKPNIKYINKLLNYYKTKEQPDQRTSDWYKFRYNGLTASSMWKALDSESNRNCLIYKKCAPLTQHNSVNINSPFHNGHKYEPLSIMIYENKHNTIVGEFGCISHKKHNFLRASPDGINIKPDSPYYGRAVEIKNPVSREITGIPKKDYWVQMQIQMEVWDLDECDFLETSFKEYDNYDDFKNNQLSFNKTQDDKLKGVIVMLNNGIEPIYHYAPITYNEEEFDIWYDNILKENNELTWIKNIYWHMEKYSCVLVVRNQKWFNYAFPIIKDTWNTIIKERKTGYDHRKPKKNKKRNKKKVKLDDLNFQKNNAKELLHLTKSPSIKNNTLVIKVRTQSFEDTMK